MDTRFAVNGDVRLAYDDLGPPGADPLLMLMGLGASRFWWPPGLVRYLRWRRQLRLLRLTRRTPDDAALAEGVLAAAATPAYPAEEGMARDAMARDRSHGIRSFRDMAAQGRQTRGRCTARRCASCERRP